jgi:pimeloyl-ACP methyl ester carboxylesterase
LKKLKQIITQVKSHPAVSHEEFNELIWQLICYSPKMSVRFQQEELLNKTEKFNLVVNDDYFAKKQLTFNGFKWGTGRHKIIITHGWGSKAADFSEIITALSEIDDAEIIAFDAPGNGSSEGDLSNLLLYILAVKAVITEFGEPDILIGHSLGGMANAIAVSELNINAPFLISITPLIRLKENFEASMNGAEVSPQAQALFLTSFEEKFGSPASHFNLNNLYNPDKVRGHFLVYDEQDKVSTFNYLEEFLNNFPAIESRNYESVGHERVIKSVEVIGDLVNAVKINLHKL